MKLDKETIKFKISRIVKKHPINGPVLLDFYTTVMSYHPFGGGVKEARVISPLFCATEKHALPTSKGYKPASEVRVEDIILLELPLIIQ